MECVESSVVKVGFEVVIIEVSVELVEYGGFELETVEVVEEIGNVEPGLPTEDVPVLGFVDSVDDDEVEPLISVEEVDPVLLDVAVFVAVLSVFGIVAKEVMEAKEAKAKSIHFQNKLLERQKVANYQNELNRMRGGLTQQELKGLTAGAFKSRIEKLEAMIKEIKTNK